MAKSNSEALLISALVNTGAIPSVHGLDESMFVVHTGEFRWLASYPDVYGAPASPQALIHKFPDLPYDSSIMDVQFAADEVRQAHVRRTLVKSLNACALHLEHDDLDSALIEHAKFTPPSLTRRAMVNKLTDKSFHEQYDKREEVLEVPWETLQRCTGGMREGDLWYLAARLSQGKSWSLGVFARDALLAGRKVKIYSLEMPEYQVLLRIHVLLGAALGLEVDHLAKRDRKFDPVKYRALTAAIAERVPGELYIHDTSMGRVSPANLAQDTEIDLAIVDYAGLMSTPVGGRAIDDWRSMGAISNMLKEVALSSGLRILAAAQINREGDTHGSVPPKVRNLAQSDALGQDADVVITHKQMSRSVMVYGLEKNRHGVANERFYSRFLPNVGKFYEIDRQKAEDLRDDENDLQ